MQKLIVCAPILACVVTALPAATQMSLYPTHSSTPAGMSPLTQPSLSPGALELLKLDSQFEEAVVKGGGAAFASWFAEDGVTLNNGKAAVFGKARITANASWKPDQYQLTWYPEFAQMGPSGDMGYTFGHYEGASKDRNGNPVKTSGRYMTIWKKAADGAWKVALDGSADEPPAAGDCCKLATP